MPSETAWSCLLALQDDPVVVGVDGNAAHDGGKIPRRRGIGRRWVLALQRARLVLHRDDVVGASGRAVDGHGHVTVGETTDREVRVRVAVRVEDADVAGVLDGERV